MRLITWFPVLSAVLWLMLRISASSYLDVHAGMNLGVFSNILIILVLVFVSLLTHHRNSPAQVVGTSFMEDFKRTLKYCLIFVLSSGVAMGLYYGLFSNDISKIRDTSMEAFQSMLQDSVARADFITQHQELVGKSDDMLIADYRSQLESNVTVHSRIIGSVFALLVVSLAYSLLGVVIWRNFMRSGKTR